MEYPEQCEHTIACGNAFETCNLTTCQCTSLTSFCGDGKLNPTTEQCDHNNPCSNGFGCNFTTCECVFNPVCGNGIIDQSLEQCDVNTGCISGLFCNTSDCSCTQPICLNNQDCAPNQQCNNGHCTPCTTDIHCAGDFTCQNGQCKPPAPRCGNGILELQEKCDDGNIFPGDGCTPLCQLERTSVAGIDLCGDGLIGDNEECDDANNRDFDGCSSQCFLEQGICGDGIVQRALNEQCEPSRHNAALPYTCSSTCRFISDTCGNAIKDEGEECDLGKQNSILPNAFCRTDCSFARCGDRIVDPQEQCDDGNKLRGDGCDNFCQLENSAADNLNQNASFLGNSNQNAQFPRYPNYPNTQAIPYQLPLASLIPQYPQGKGPYGDTGPAAVVFVASGAAGGIAWMRKRKY